MPGPLIVSETTFSGFEAIEVRNDFIRLIIIPTLGGKIISLKHIPSNREWLAQNPHLPLKQANYGESFTELHDTGGLDECFPSVAAIRYPESEKNDIPDHGDLWCQPWDLNFVLESDEKIIIDMVCQCIAIPVSFKRRLSLEANSSTLTLDYKVSNQSAKPLPFVWSIHPILQIETGMFLSLPACVDTLRIDGSSDGFVDRAAGLCDWPTVNQGAYRGLDLSRIPDADFGHAAKFYTQSLQGSDVVEVCLQDPSREHALGFRFKPTDVTHIGLWMNYGGWSGCDSAPYFNLGLEPCIGGADSLLDAQTLNECASLEPHQTKQWALELFVY
jgi:galactose mutarotase-like enzyme